MIYKTLNGYKISDGSAALVPLEIPSKKFKAELLLQDSYIIYLFNSLNTYAAQVLSHNFVQLKLKLFLQNTRNTSEKM